MSFAINPRIRSSQPPRIFLIDVFIVVFFVHGRHRLRWCRTFYSHCYLTVRFKDLNWKSNELRIFYKSLHFYCYTFKASSCDIVENGLPLTSKIESPGLRPTLSAMLPSSTRDIYTPTSILI